MPETLDAKAFRGWLNQPFRIEVEGQDAIEAILVRVDEIRGDTQRADETPFSVLFRGPADAPLPQQIYPLRGEEGLSLDLFLVCVGPDPDDEMRGMLYEAVFT